MAKKILWIDDDFFAIQGLFRPLIKQGYTVQEANSALDGYRKALSWQEYDLIVVDLIITVDAKQETTPEIVKKWDDEEEYPQVGIGIIKWLLGELKVTCPVAILSIVSDPIKTYHLEALGLAGSIRKDGLLPTDLKDQIQKILAEHSS
jgi:CheY-like chemotaxis protein